MTTVSRVIVLGGGSAGFLTALALKTKLPDLHVRVIRSKDIGIIGVGEGSTVALTDFLHKYLKVGPKKFFQVAQPTWKLGLRFLWGPRPMFHYSFGLGLAGKYPGMAKNLGFYGDEDMDTLDPVSTLMRHDRAFPRAANGGPEFHRFVAYHFENERFVQFLEGFAAAVGVEIVEDTVRDVTQDERGVSGLVMASGRTETADLYVDCSGFASVLLGRALGEPFRDFRSSLFCDRAVVGGWDRAADEPIRPYTTCETMDAGWAWQIEHEHRVNRGYVYCSAFIADADAEREFRARNPRVGPTRVVRFVSGRYERCWVKNVVAIGNAGGFVEPLEATALGAIAVQAGNLADSLIDADRQLRPTQVERYTAADARNWDSIRAFIAVHYKFNTRLDTPFWRECREKTDLAGAEPVVAYYQDNGPSSLWGKTLLDPLDQFGMAGYLALLLGQQVPYRRAHVPTEQELKVVQAHRQKNVDRATRALTVREALGAIRAPSWKWTVAPAGA